MLPGRCHTDRVPHRPTYSTQLSDPPDIVGPVSCIPIREHAEALTVRQAIAKSCQSRGVLAGLFYRSEDLYNPTYNHDEDGSACCIYGCFPSRELLVHLRAFRIRHLLKRPRPANLHVTALGHSYSSHIHVEHSRKLLVPFVDRILTTFSYVHVTLLPNFLSTNISQRPPNLR